MDTIHLTLTEDEHTLLMWTLGVAAAFADRTEKPELIGMLIDLANRVAHAKTD